MLKKLIMIAVTAIGIARSGEVHQSMNRLMGQLVREGRTVKQAIPIVTGAYMKATIERCEASVRGVPAILRLKDSMEQVRGIGNCDAASRAMESHIRSFINDTLKLPGELTFLVTAVANIALKYMAFYCLGRDELIVVGAIEMLKERLSANATPFRAIVEAGVARKVETLNEQVEFLTRLYGGQDTRSPHDVHVATTIRHDRLAMFQKVLEPAGRRVQFVASIVEPIKKATHISYGGIVPCTTPTITVVRREAVQKSNPMRYIYKEHGYKLGWRQVQGEWRPNYLGEGESNKSAIVKLLSISDIKDLILQCNDTKLAKLNIEEQRIILNMKCWTEGYREWLRLEPIWKEKVALYDRVWPPEGMEKEEKLKDAVEARGQVEVQVGKIARSRRQIEEDFKLLIGKSYNTDELSESDTYDMMLPWLLEVLHKMTGFNVSSWYSGSWLEPQRRNEDEWQNRWEGKSERQAEVVLSGDARRILSADRMSKCSVSEADRDLVRKIWSGTSQLTADQFSDSENPRDIISRISRILKSYPIQPGRKKPAVAIAENEIGELAWQLEISAAG
jgi:hypothetical protein